MKVFIDDKPLIFGDVYRDTLFSKENFLILSEGEYSIDEVIALLSKKKNKGVMYMSASPDQTWKRFISRYILSEAAGGLVKNKEGDFLIIYRKKRWDLPKGKLDYAETPEDAAVREVKEECGLKNIELGDLITRTFHTYTEKNKFILKKTHWFNMTTGDMKLRPQASESIEEAVWMTKAMIDEKVFKKTYESIKEVFEIHFSKDQ